MYAFLKCYEANIALHKNKIMVTSQTKELLLA